MEKTSGMSSYETVFLAHQDISSAALQDLGDLFSKIIENKGGKVIKREYWGLRKLAYKIKKTSQAHYLFLGIQAYPETLTELNKRIKLTSEVIRTFILKVKHLDSEPTAMIRKSRDKEE